MKPSIEATVSQRFDMARLGSLDDLVRHYRENAPEPEPEPTRTLEVPVSVWEQYQHVLVSLGVERGGNEGERFTAAIAKLMELEQALKPSGVQYLSDLPSLAIAPTSTEEITADGDDMTTTIQQAIATAIAPLQQRLDRLESLVGGHTTTTGNDTDGKTDTADDDGETDGDEWERYEAMSYLELKGYRRQSEAATVRLLKATEAVKQYNLHCPEAAGRWYLNGSQLQQLTGTAYSFVKSFLNSHEVLVSEVNTTALDGFDGGDRALNRKGYSISDAIPEPTIDFILDDPQFWGQALYTRASSGKWNSTIPLKDGGRALVQGDRTSLWNKDGELVFEAKLVQNDKGNYSTWVLNSEL